MLGLIHVNSYCDNRFELLKEVPSYFTNKEILDKNFCKKIKDQLQKSNTVFEELNQHKRAQFVKKTFSNKCEEVTESYAICNGDRYERVRSVRNNLKRDVKRINDFIQQSEKLKNSEAAPK
ncbi:MAG: hypothetical protein Q7U04_04590 [Bacteriovorax sp.]|nr:hypothetical protein [Bacteriovorax sp.]